MRDTDRLAANIRGLGVKGLVGAILAICFAAGSALAQPAPGPLPVDQSTKSNAAPTASANLTREDVGAWLDGFLPYALERADIAGAVVVVVKDGNVLFKKGYGYADVAAKRPVDPDLTLFRPGSISKLFTWTAVMQLVEQHRIDLDQDVNAYLDFKIPPLKGKPITMRELMTHTPGFENTLEEVIAVKPTYPKLRDFLKNWMPPRIFPAGEVPAYSNYGAALAGYIVERISGQPFPQYIAQHIFAPLGMNHSTFLQPPPAALAPLVSRGYLSAADEPGPFEMLGATPAGGLSASGADIARFMIAHLQNGEYDGHRILQAATAQEMHSTPYTTISPALNRMTLGFFQLDRNGHRIIGHDADSARQALESIGRVGLDHVEHTKKHEADERQPPTRPNCEQGNQHPEHFVDDDDAGVPCLVAPLGHTSRPCAENGHNDDGEPKPSVGSGQHHPERQTCG